MHTMSMEQFSATHMHTRGRDNIPFRRASRISLHAVYRRRRRLCRWPLPNTNYQHDMSEKVFATVVSSISRLQFAFTRIFLRRGFENNAAHQTAIVRQLQQFVIVFPVWRGRDVSSFPFLRLKFWSSRHRTTDEFLLPFPPAKYSCREECQRNSYCIFQNMRT